MKIFKLVLTILFGVLLILGGISHFMNPLMYASPLRITIPDVADPS